MKEHNGFYEKLRSHGVTMYAVAKAGGWSWQQVAEWANGTRVPQIATFKQLQRVMQDFGIEIDVDDFGKGGEQ